MKLRFVAVLVFFVLFAVVSRGQDMGENFASKIDALIPKGIDDSTPGLVIGIVQNGKLLFHKEYGLANLSYGIANNSEIIYNIGSVSKQFLGYAFALLQERGVLDLDEPVGKYLDDWPKFKYPVSIRHLLTHTSGYREAYTLSNLAGRPIGIDRLSRKECLDVVRRQPELEFVPGSRFSYNSTAWVILAEILEKVTKVSADEWVTTNIFQPLKMNDTKIERYVGEVIPNAAESYSYEKKQGYVNAKSNRSIFAAADVYTNINDLVKWINNFRSMKVGNKAAYDLFLEPFILNDGSNSEYALGISSGTYRGLTRYRHTGSHEAFLTQLSYYPAYNLGIITISNFGRKGWVPTTKIAELLLEEYMTQPMTIDHPIKMEANKLEKFVGLYVSNSFNRTIQLTLKDDQLHIDGKTRMSPVAPNSFRIAGWDGQIQLVNQSNGAIQLNMLNKGQKVFTKVEKWTPKKSTLKDYIGDYWCDELETIYHLVVKDGKLIIQHRWLGEIQLIPISKDFFHSSQGFYVKFNRKGDKFANLSISSARTLNVMFHPTK